MGELTGNQPISVYLFPAAAGWAIAAASAITSAGITAALNPLTNMSPHVLDQTMTRLPLCGSIMHRVLKWAPNVLRRGSRRSEAHLGRADL